LLVPAVKQAPARRARPSAKECWRDWAPSEGSSETIAVIGVGPSRDQVIWTQASQAWPAPPRPPRRSGYPQRRSLWAARCPDVSLPLAACLAPAEVVVVAHRPGHPYSALITDSPASRWPMRWHFIRVARAQKRPREACLPPLTRIAEVAGTGRVARSVRNRHFRADLRSCRTLRRSVEHHQRLPGR
jgi:hypothetical protein